MSFRSKRRTIGERDGWACTYCDTPLTLETSTLDHVIPVCAGGSNQNWNLVLACHECNARKREVSGLVYVVLAHVCTGVAA